MDWDEDRSYGSHCRRPPHHGQPARNLDTAILRLTGATSIAAALRYRPRRPSRPLRALKDR